MIDSIRATFAERALTSLIRGMTRIRAKIYHKLVEPLHRPAETIAAGAKASLRNA
jgi:hypothetical protein